MSFTRRRFLGRGATALGAAAVGVGLSSDDVFAQDIVFSTIEAGLEYEIEQGRVNEIKIVETSPNLPGFAPAERQTDFGNVVIKYNLKWVRSDVRTPNDLRLWLFRPKTSVTNASTIYDPPTYAGHGSKGNYTLRYPEGDNTFPIKENTPLWINYIAPNWDLVPGAHYTVDDVITAAETDNTQWPGPRAVSAFHWTGSFGLFPAIVPLRVAREGIPRDGELLLTLLEIRRLGRLRLMARTLMVKPVIANGICPTTALATPVMGGHLDVLRSWRNDSLMQSRFGRRLVKAYYRAAPVLSNLIDRAPILRPAGQAAIRMVVRRVESRPGIG